MGTLLSCKGIKGNVADLDYNSRVYWLLCSSTHVWLVRWLADMDLVNDFHLQGKEQFEFKNFNK